MCDMSIYLFRTGGLLGQPKPAGGLSNPMIPERIFCQARGRNCGSVLYVYKDFYKQGEEPSILVGG